VRPSWTRIGAALAGLAVGGAFLAYAFHGTPAAAVWAILRHGNWPLPAAVVLGGTALFCYAKAARWRLLLAADPGLPLGPLARAVLVGLALNACVPHAGEFVRAFSVQRGFGRAASAVLSSIVAERVFDLFAVLLLGAAALSVAPVSADLAAAFRALAVFAAALAGGVVVSLAAPRRVRRIAALVVAWAPERARVWVLAQVDHALAGFAPVRSPSNSLRVLLWSLLQWLAVAVCVGGCAAVAGFTTGVATALLVVVGIVIAFLLPNAPGYAGSVQVAFLLVLRPLGVPDESALAASVVYQLLMIGPTVLVGLALLRTSLARAPINAP
jgi:glycosyltransferase 2 family protein